MVNIRNNNNG
jgi:hypothetical protein